MSNATKAEELVDRIKKLEDEKRELEHGIEAIRNYYMKNPFFRTTTTRLFWSWNADKPLSNVMCRAFRDFLTKEVVKVDNEIGKIRKQLKLPEEN